MILQNTNSKRKDSGFTIVELLVVIVVIGILAAITIVSYTGVTTKANASASKQNANSVVSAAEAVYAETGSYPAESAVVATQLTNLSAQSAKVSSGISVSTTNPSASNTPTVVGYHNKTTGICVAYYDGGVVYLVSGNTTCP